MCSRDPLLRQVAVLQLTAALKRLTRCASLPKVPRVERDAENDFGAGEATGEDVVDAGLARFAERGVDVVDVAGGREELGVVAAHVGPGAREVVAHEIQHVEKVGGGGKVNVLETVLPDWECCGEKVVWRRESLANISKKEEIIAPRLRIRGMFPIDLP